MVVVVTDPMVTMTTTWVSVSVMHMVGPGAELPGQPEYAIGMSIGTVCEKLSGNFNLPVPTPKLARW